VEDIDEGEVGNGTFRRLLGSNFVEEVVTLVKALLIITPVDVLLDEFTSWFLSLSVWPLQDASKISS
jgi:hypothetical protein